MASAETRILEGSVGGRSTPIVELSDPDQGVRAEVWPAQGFNCLRWQVARGQDWTDLLYVDPDWNHNPVPTRSGIPLLFPFPNRIRDGQYNWGSRAYSLPRNDPAKQNAIHGFAPRHAWEIRDHGSSETAAWIQGIFALARAAPDCLPLWPGDCLLEATYRLQGTHLRLELSVHNLDTSPVPFGLGLHPYFRLPGEPSEDGITTYQLQAATSMEWELRDNLPTGNIQPVDAGLDFTEPRPLGNTNLDHLYTQLQPLAVDEELFQLAALTRPPQLSRLEIWVSEGFREMVLYTPPHRRAVCIEPYTCPTDAIHLAAGGMDVGWQTLEPGGVWSATVEFRWYR